MLLWAHGCVLGYILGLYWDNGKVNGSYYNGFYIGEILGYIQGRSGQNVVKRKLRTTHA